MLATAIRVSLRNMLNKSMGEIGATIPPQVINCSTQSILPVSVSSALSVSIRNAQEGTKTLVYEAQIENRYEESSHNLEAVKMANIESATISNNVSSGISNSVNTKVKNVLDIRPFHTILSTIRNLVGNIKIFTIPEEIIINLTKIIVSLSGKRVQEYFSIRAGETITISINYNIWSNNGTEYATS